MSHQLENTSQSPSFVCGYLTLPKKYELHCNVVTDTLTVTCLITVIADAFLLFTIFKDPCKQRRTITGILLTYNSAASLCIAIIALITNFLWRNSSPILIFSLTTCLATFYFIGNLLHTVSIYGAIVTPIRYKLLEQKFRKVMAPTLSLTWLIITSAYVIAPYIFPNEKTPIYSEIILTKTCVLLVLLTLVFIICYTRIFQTLYARERQLKSTFQVTRSSHQGLKILKQNHEVAKTLFIYVLFFVITSASGSIAFMMYLHCTSCELKILQLGTLFVAPLFHLSFAFYPLLWLLRPKSNRQTLKKLLCCNRFTTAS
jgi:hypothetical protein